MTLLELMQEFCRRTGLPRPAVVASSQDDMLLQLTGLLNEVVVDLVTRFRWEALSSEAAWSAVAGEDQGAMTTLAPGFDDMVPNTFWNRSVQIQYAPCLSAAEWAAQKATNMTGFYQFRILRGHLYLRAAPAVGEQLSFEYRDNRAILSALFRSTSIFRSAISSATSAAAIKLLPASSTRPINIWMRSNRKSCIVRLSLPDATSASCTGAAVHQPISTKRKSAV